MSFSPFEIRELWYYSHGSTYPTAFLAGNDATWTGSGVKLRFHGASFEPKQEFAADATSQTRVYGKPAKLETRKGGELKFRMYLEGGSATTAAGTVATLLSKAMGGLKSPTNITDAVEAASTATQINATTHGQVIGQAVLVGIDGDGRGGGKVGVIASKNTSDYTFSMALPGAPTATLPDALKNGHTCYMDNVENYLSFLAVGHYAGSGATDDPDIINALGCSSSAAMIGGLAPGDLPYIEFTFQVGTWRNEPYATTKALAHTTAASGGAPVSLVGSRCLGDNGATTRSTFQGTIDDINLGIALVQITDHNNAESRGGFVQVPSETGATTAVTLYWSDMPGLTNDATGQTTKQLIVQLGNVAQGCVVIDMQRCFFDDIPTRAEIEKNLAIKLPLHADSGQATALSTADLRLQDSPVRVHFL